MKLIVKNQSGGDVGELQVKFPIVEDSKGNQAVHDTVVAYQASQRAGTACTKTRGEVAGSNKKPWRQKGTGRARAGSFRSPLWRGGGVTFGPKPRDFSKKVNQKVRQLALRKSLSERLKAGEVIVIEDINLSAPKTKEFVKFINSLKLDGTVGVVVGTLSDSLRLASRNVQGVFVTTGTSLNTYQVLLPKNLVFTREGFEAVEKRLMPNKQ
jgi:large subunit ribosomal protein L4